MARRLWFVPNWGYSPENNRRPRFTGEQSTTIHHHHVELRRSEQQWRQVCRSSHSASAGFLAPLQVARFRAALCSAVTRDAYHFVCRTLLTTTISQCVPADFELNPPAPPQPARVLRLMCFPVNSTFRDSLTKSSRDTTSDNWPAAESSRILLCSRRVYYSSSSTFTRTSTETDFSPECSLLTLWFAMGSSFQSLFSVAPMPRANSICKRSREPVPVDSDLSPPRIWTVVTPASATIPSVSTI